ncbi:uncharacterized protein LOC122655032 [Telopea speciosissima]|uniref:uncharacterized protein LOC122655032 n=1 Tax=Telopea speciosissima TaxID=54955 RepID=UPI001CC45998|nr:uncharacterized protein LOC122655032 [Telopea speciosissima]
MIWNCKAYPKIRAFLWRTCAQGLASGDNLARRQIPIDSSCRRCGHAFETSDHILLDCPFTRATWFGSNLSFIVPSDELPMLASVLKTWDQIRFPSKKGKAEVLSLFAFICWHLWLACNDLVFNQRVRSPIEVFNRAHQAHFRILQRESSSFSADSPPLGYLKLNCDASYIPSSGSGGFGIVIRNHEGAPIMAYSEPFKASSSLMAEALALRAGMCAILDANLVVFLWNQTAQSWFPS